jgi:hypothetical protein
METLASGGVPEAVAMLLAQERRVAARNGGVDPGAQVVS